MLGQYYLATGAGAFLLVALAVITGLFGRQLRKVFPGRKVLLTHKVCALGGVLLALLHVLGAHGD
ncbi:hypothetical protein [Aminivibrio sp.]|jgi:hypothetical protein|uniref:hypothetical protein n=1 Tax=Aminivibrio sp. TaxID=1872489 RepID=UPI001A3B6650|nr:hypothetical protein [Aminivibrio sp.]MBL3539899.1 hypothetical protein [Aminivibrio sp.]MDK2958546.1 hypothetical protein [Synergistaceae bacterium]